MKRKINLIYFDGVLKYKFAEIKRNHKGEFIIIPALFNSKSIDAEGNHFTYHEDGYYNTTLQASNGFNFSFKGPTLKPISQFKGVMQIMCLGKGAFEANLLKSVKLQEDKQEISITKTELDKIPEPNINLLLLEPNRMDILEKQKPYSIFLKENHILRYFDKFNPWVVLLVGSGASVDGRCAEQRSEINQN